MLEGVEARALCGPVMSFSAKVMKPRVCRPCFMHWSTVVLEQRRASPKPPPRIALSKTSWFAEALRLPFSGDKRPSTNPGKTGPYLHTTSSELHSWHSSVRYVMFSQRQPNPHSPVCQKEEQFSLQSTFPLLPSPVSVCFAMEAHTMN